MVLVVITMAGGGESILLRHVSNVAIVSSLVGLIDILIDKQVISMCFCWKTSFFVYCFHRVPVEYAGKFMGGIDALNMDIVYLLFVVGSVLFALGIAHVLHRYLPVVYIALNGARK